jgi:hypothetical protein
MYTYVTYANIRIIRIRFPRLIMSFMHYQNSTTYFHRVCIQSGIVRKKLGFEARCYIIVIYLNVQSRAINFGRQGHFLTQSKMLHCKTVVNIITYQSYHHVVCINCHFFLSFFWHFFDMGIIRQGNFLNLWQSNQILKWHWGLKFIARDSRL